jgi:hypothetical protein
VFSSFVCFQAEEPHDDEAQPEKEEDEEEGGGRHLLSIVFKDAYGGGFVYSGYTLATLFFLILFCWLLSSFFLIVDNVKR